MTDLKWSRTFSIESDFDAIILPDVKFWDKLGRIQEIGQTQ